MNELSGLNGPDFLQEVAETNLHNGDRIAYSEWLRRSKQWREDRARIGDLERELARANDRLTAAQRAVTA